VSPGPGKSVSDDRHARSNANFGRTIEPNEATITRADADRGAESSIQGGPLPKMDRDQQWTGEAAGAAVWTTTGIAVAQSLDLIV
jgi:hypothetical protein